MTHYLLLSQKRQRSPSRRRRARQGSYAARRPSTKAPRSGRELALAEYNQLKAEQLERIGFRDSLLRDTLIAIAGVLTLTVSAHTRSYLLLVPAVTVLLGWKYLHNDHMITAIGRYIREHRALSASMGWELDHRDDRRRGSRKLIQLGVDVSTFCGSALAALTVFWLAPEQPLELAGSLIEAAAAALLSWQFISYADLFPAR
jgi:hypothetical protein